MLSSWLSRRAGSSQPQHEPFGEGTSSTGREEWPASLIPSAHVGGTPSWPFIPEPVQETPMAEGAEGDQLAGKAPAQPAPMPLDFGNIPRARRVIHQSKR